MIRLKREEVLGLFPPMKPIVRVRAICGETPRKIKDTVLNLNDGEKPQWDTGTFRSPVLTGDMLYLN